MASFSPEHWHLIPTIPRIGSLLDPYGGRTVESYEEKEDGDTLWETAVGLVEIHSSEEGFNLLAKEMGIGLFYEKSGCLTNAGVDILNFCDSCSEESCEKMGGDNLEEMLEVILEKKCQLLVYFDFEDNTVTLVEVDRLSGKGTILGSAECLDLSSAILMKIEYDEYYLYIGLRVVEDVFHFGLSVTGWENDPEPDKTMMMTKILFDCNYQTFLRSLSPDKYDKLARRIFFADY